MKKIYTSFAIFFNIALLLVTLHFYNRNNILDNLVNNYQINYVDIERYRRVSNKVDDYEWILKNIYKVDGIDAMRMYWCKR
jgi:hypothetical protein